PEYPILRVQDVMVIKILAWNEWKKPIHFAITVPTSNLLNLDPYLTMVGLSVKVSPEPTDGVDDAALEHNLLKKYRFRGLTDPSLYKDENSERLLGNYWACVLQLARSYEKQGRTAEAPQLMQWARDNIYMSWENHYAAADYFSTLGQHDIAIEHIHDAVLFLIERVGVEPAATYDNIIALTGVLIQEPYSAYDRAVGLYHQAIALAPKRWEGYYELAATLQAKGDVAGALAVLQQYKEQYGERPELVEAEGILRQSTTP
ncbi:MAG: tetratricopeptide repeat protein, partial [Gemmatimonadota bacterium]|nr:tetratricopeptide repeat protein [Gemmatimonadota bacterium]